MDGLAENRGNNRALFAYLLLGGLFGILVGVPWDIAVLRDSSTAWLSAAAELLLLLVPTCAAGVWLGNKVGLAARLRALVSGVPGGWEDVRLSLLPAVPVGLVLGGVGFFAQNSIPKRALMPGVNNPDIFEWFLRCLSAALTEEITFRFGLIAFFVWLIRAIVRDSATNMPSLWIGVLLSALLFAAAHLPQLTFRSWNALIPFVLFSSSAGMVMGWLFIRYGLVTAVLAHFITDLMVYVVPRLTAPIM